MRSFKRHRKGATALAAASIGIMVVAVLLLSAGGAVGATTVNVAIPGLSFSPSSITINIGDTVTWTNTDTIIHTTTSNTGLWDSGVMAPGATFSHTFTQAGTFNYLCTTHGFTGIVVVQATTTTPPTTTPTTQRTTTTTSASTTTTTSGTTATTQATTTTVAPTATTVPATTTTLVPSGQPSFTG